MRRTDEICHPQQICIGRGFAEENVRGGAAIVAVIAATVFVVLARPSAQSKSESLSGVQRLEGDWVRIDLNGSGDFGGLTSKFTPASLTPQRRLHVVRRPLSS